MILLLAIGCADYNLTGKGGELGAQNGADTAAPWDTAGAGGDADTGGSDSAELPPASYTLRATVTVSDGAPSVEGAAATILVVADDDATVLCEVPLSVDGLAVGNSGSEDVPAWWTMEVNPTARACATLPTRLGFGVGVLAADAAAMLDATDLGAVSASLYGAYIREGNGPVYVYGWAGTKLDTSGDDEAALPLPDGTYTLTPLYLLALP